MRVISTDCTALETGQFRLASSALFAKVSASMPRTDPSVARSIREIAKPPGTGPKCTFAVVWIFAEVWPPSASVADKAMEKQAAWAAAISSSGLVPVPSSKRE